MLSHGAAHLRAESQTGFRPELATTYQLLAVQHFLSASQHARTTLCMLPRSQRCLGRNSTTPALADIADTGAAWAHAWCTRLEVSL